MVSGCLSNKDILSDVLPVYETKHGKDWITATELRWIFVKTTRMFKQHGCIPSKQILLSILREETGKASSKSKEERESIHETYETLLDRLFGTASDMSREEASAISGRMVKLLRNREVANAGAKFAELIQSGEVEAGLEHVKAAVLRIDELDSDDNIMISDLFDMEEEIDYIRRRRAHPEEFVGIPTGIRVFDDETKGVHPGETGLIIAPSGRGKTTLACEFGYNALRVGYNVCQFTIESSIRLVKFKYFSRISGIPYNNFKFALENEDLPGCSDWLDTWQERMQSLMTKVSSRLKIVDVPEGCTPNVIENVCKNRFAGWRPDLVIIDHQGLLSPDKGSGKGGRLGWESQGEITQSLMGKARSMFNSRGERGIAMWILAQGHSSLMKKKAEDVSVADVGLSYLIAQPAHYIIHIIRDEIMAANDEAILKLSKVRDGRDNLIAYCTTDFATSTFVKREESGTAEDMQDNRIIF